jgi:hypothetical protein
MQGITKRLFFTVDNPMLQKLMPGTSLLADGTITSQLLGKADVRDDPLF